MFIDLNTGEFWSWVQTHMHYQNMDFVRAISYKIHTLAPLPSRTRGSKISDGKSALRVYKSRKNVHLG